MIYSESSLPLLRGPGNSGNTNMRAQNIATPNHQSLKKKEEFASLYEFSKASKGVSN